MKKNILILGALLLILGAVIYITKPVDERSFNPNPPIKLSPTADPAALLKNPWRARYSPFLAKVAPPETSPGFYVYPFLDRTKEGVGINCTYGWHLMGNCALAAWTSARLVGFAPPQHYGLPAVDEKGANTDTSFSGWIQQALKDPATKDARYLICGAYDFDPAKQQYTLQIKLVDREGKGTEAETAIYETSLPTVEDFAQLAAVQRTAARAIARKLIKTGKVQPRPAVEVQGIQLETELKDVAQMLDANDSWAVMEGIDRALQLAALFPKETLPLQAASYGLNETAWTMFSYGYQTTYDYDYLLRAYALAQLSLTINPNPALSQLNWFFSCKHLGHPVDQQLKALKDASGAPLATKHPELWGYFLASVDEMQAGFTPDQQAAFPDWQILRQEMQSSLFINSSPYRQYLVTRLPNWKDHDLYLQSNMQAEWHDYNRQQYGSTGPFMGKNECADSALQSTLAAELASLMVAQKSDTEASGLIKAISKIGLDIKDVSELAKARDYYGLRQAFLEAMSEWVVPTGPNFPALNLLQFMAGKAEIAYQDPGLARTPSGFRGFEFTPADRIEFTQRRDHLGPMQLAELEGKQKGVYSTLVTIASAYLSVRPNNTSAQTDFAEDLDSYITEEKAMEMRVAAFQKSQELFPLDSEVTYRLGRSCYYQGNTELGNRYLAAYYRTEPFYPFRNKLMGELFERYGYRTKAVAYYDKFLKDVPTRYDIANKRAWLLCQMGKWNDPKIRATFALPAARLYGNSSFHEDYLNYLFYWAKDYRAARQAALAFVRSHNNQPNAAVWLARVEAADGNTTKALEVLDNANLDDLQSLSLAVAQAALANGYLELNRTDLAQPHVKAAMEVDEWQGDVIVAMAKLAYAQGDYKEAAHQHVRALNRYGFNTTYVRGLASCYEKQKNPRSAIAMLEPFVFEHKAGGNEPFLIPQLMRLYAENKKTERADAAMDIMVKSGLHTRGDLIDTLEAYKKINPAKAAEIEKRVDQIMAGPES